ncbi:TOBE domain-containing protein [Halomicroarcula sp. F13]|uniref:TOBE domain-containing protein n=1 Tax=Haloarcula rubra TaxID=2487747 RepID=A0AAW4PLL3_9EURY|nr:TOBE domain-containing protein [Halomicroarcula rubra]MBX0321609.1 TOBE domain-containing protein [Halomicroarcula rubra]
MVLSARNNLRGTVTAVEMDGVMAEVVVELDDGQTVTSTITRASVERLDLVPGDDVSAVVKASDVMIDAE